MTDETSKESKLSEERQPLRKGVQIVGGGAVRGVNVESKDSGGSLETTVELGGPGTDERDEEGRRKFR